MSQEQEMMKVYARLKALNENLPNRPNHLERTARQNGEKRSRIRKPRATTRMEVHERDLLSRCRALALAGRA